MIFRARVQWFLRVSTPRSELQGNAEGRVYPPLHKIRDVSLAIAVAVAQVAYAEGLARAPKPEDVRAHIKSLMFEPSYRSYV